MAAKKGGGGKKGGSTAAPARSDGFFRTRRDIEEAMKAAERQRQESLRERRIEIARMGVRVYDGG